MALLIPPESQEGITCPFLTADARADVQRRAVTSRGWKVAPEDRTVAVIRLRRLVLFPLIIAAVHQANNDERHRGSVNRKKIKTNTMTGIRPYLIEPVSLKWMF